MKKNVIYLGSTFLFFMLYFKSKIGGFMKDKVNKGLLITVVVLVLVIGLLIFRLTKDTVNTNKDKNTKSDNNTQVVEKVEGAKDFDLKEAEQLLNKFGFNERIGCGPGIYDHFYDESFKQAVVLRKVSDSVKTNKKCSELYTELYQGTPGAYNGEYGVCYENNGTSLIPYDEANKIYKELYDKDMHKKGFTTYGFYYNLYDYNESLDSFVQLECGGCGGACGPNLNINKIKSAYTIDDNLVIEVYYFDSGVDNDYIYVNTSKGHLNLKASEKKIDPTNGVEADEVIKEAKKEIEEKYLDKLDVYDVVFTKKDGNYIFKKKKKKLS